MPNPFSRNSAPELPNAIVGAARRVNLRRRDEVDNLRERSSEEWQKLAWRHYDEIGEIKYAFNYFASIASRVRLFAGYQSDDNSTPADIGEVGGLDRSFVTAARYELGKLFKGRGGQPNLIRSTALNLLVAGECYLVEHAGTYAIRSTSELEADQNGRIRLKLSRIERHNTGTYLPDDAFAARIWRTHPQYSEDADSSLKGVAQACEELLLLSRIIKVTGQSTLNAGILYVADELRFQRSVDPTGEANNPDVDPFEEELSIGLTEPIEGSSPSEIIPMIIRGPADLAEKAIIKIDLSRGFDETLLKRHEKTLDRILDGIDLPKELVQGLANVRYSNARTISEDLLKAHIEPMMVIICEAFATAYLRPALLERGYDPDLVSNVQVWYDASEVVTRPDRSEDADKGYGLMTVSGATWRRAHGFTENDKPSDEEIALRVALAGSVAPNVTLDFLRQMAPELVAKAEQLANEAMHDPDTADAVAVETGDTGTPTPNPNLNPNPQPNPRLPGVPSPRPTEEPAANPPEGGLERGVVGGDNRNANQILQLLAQFSTAKKDNEVVRTRTRKLDRALDVERQLRSSLNTLINEVVARSLEKAGARTVSKVRGDAELKSLVADVALTEAFAAIPSSRRAEFALGNERKLVEDTIEGAKPYFERMVREAQSSGWRSLGIFDKMTPTQDANLGRAWSWLSSKLVDTAVNFLRKPKTEGNYVDMGLIRTVQAIAGGASDSQRDSGRAVLSRDALDATGWDFADGFRWVHGVSDSEFEPHEKLDDGVFETWDAAELATNVGEYPYVSHYYPGDHPGCRCDWLPVVLAESRSYE